MNKNCQNCQKEFEINKDDISFYEKIGVPTPTFCPECRQQRRYAWRNERVLYRRNCNLCQKSTVTIYSPDKDLRVYCLKCWWSDKWNPTEYGFDFDFSRPFFEQYKKLQIKVPRMALLNKRSINSEYTNHSGDNKNVYMSFVSFDGEDIIYSTWIINSRDCIDCNYIYDKGEKSYECVDSQKIYNCQYSFILENCVNCFYCYDCRNCNDCFLSSNLRSKSYIFKNQQYTREEYFKKIKEYNLSSFKIRRKLEKEFHSLMLNNSIHRCVIGERNYNSIGSSIFETKNVKITFDGAKLEDGKYLYSVLDLKTAMDLYHVGIKTELVYENHGCTRVYNTSFSHLCYDNSNISYCDSCQNSQNLFGCISIKKGEYMIFNKKYSKEEYLELKEKIIEHMKKTGEYGEYFPPSVAPICYNETQGQLYMPMTKEEVISKGWLWQDKLPGIFNKETIKNLPDTIEEIENNITSEILKCINCRKNYNIISNEFTFYKKEKIPLPRKCPDCRYKRRFNLRLPRRLWNRECMKCNKKIQSVYAPNRLEIVYCKQCYQQEIL